MPASFSVAVEFVRALAGLVLLPARVVGYLVVRARLRREVLEDLRCADPGVAEPPSTQWPERPLDVFVSCAEVSGEIHACHFVRALRELAAQAGAPAPRFRGLGGAALAELGVEIVGDPVGRAAMGTGVWRALPFYLGLLRDALQSMQTSQPDVFVPIDSPALHVPLARMARARGVRVVHYVTPQYWAWAPWRQRDYRHSVDLALTILPFEPNWFARAGLRCAHVGHPLLDELPISGEALELRAEPRSKRHRLVLLPGSRHGVVTRNLPWMLRVLERVRSEVPELDVVLPHSRADLRPTLEACLHDAGASDWATIETGDLHAVLAEADSAFAVSGTILIDLVHERLPMVVVYRLAGAREEWMYRNLLSVPWFASPNLLVGRSIVPEYCFAGDGPIDEVTAAVRSCLGDETWRAECRAGLEEAAQRLGPPGAARRAAGFALFEAAAARGEKP